MAAPAIPQEAGRPAGTSEIRSPFDPVSAGASKTATQDCQSVEALKPADCRRCGESLTGSDLAPLRHQVREIPEIKPLVTESQLHRLICRCCSTSTCAELPAGVPQSQAGPRRVALAALLMGASSRPSGGWRCFWNRCSISRVLPVGWSSSRIRRLPRSRRLRRNWRRVCPPNGFWASTNHRRKKPGSNRGCGRLSPAGSRSLRCAPPGPRRFCSNC